jgi:hypothetical protein
LSFHIDVFLKSKISGVFRGIKGIRALAARLKKKKHHNAMHQVHHIPRKVANRKAAALNNIPQPPHQRRMLEEDDELVGTESEGEFPDDELYGQDIDAFIEHYLDNELRKFVAAIRKSLAEEEVSKSTLSRSWEI